MLGGGEAQEPGVVVVHTVIPEAERWWQEDQMRPYATGVEFMGFHLRDRYSTTELHPFIKSHLLAKHGKKIINSRSAWAEERRKRAGGNALLVVLFQCWD